jgi:hypothetical protein
MVMAISVGDFVILHPTAGPYYLHSGDCMDYLRSGDCMGIVCEVEKEGYPYSRRARVLWQTGKIKEAWYPLYDLYKVESDE